TVSSIPWAQSDALRAVNNVAQYPGDLPPNLYGNGHEANAMYGGTGAMHGLVVNHDVVFFPTATRSVL
ncbi:MAG: hypothetical protein ACKPKO_42530, partial [Candidatus Fonsibacter sp.]